MEESGTSDPTDCDANLAGSRSGVMQNSFVTTGATATDSSNPRMQPSTVPSQICETWPPSQFQAFHMLREQMGPRFHLMREPCLPHSLIAGLQQHPQQQQLTAHQSAAVKRSQRKAKMLEKQKASNRASSKRSPKVTKDSKDPESQAPTLETSNQLPARRQPQTEGKSSGPPVMENSQSSVLRSPFSPPPFKNFQFAKGVKKKHREAEHSSLLGVCEPLRRSFSSGAEMAVVGNPSGHLRQQYSVPCNKLSGVPGQEPSGSSRKLKEAERQDLTMHHLNSVGRLSDVMIRRESYRNSPPALGEKNAASLATADQAAHSFHKSFGENCAATSTASYADLQRRSVVPELQMPCSKEMVDHQSGAGHTKMNGSLLFKQESVLGANRISQSEMRNTSKQAQSADSAALDDRPNLHAASFVKAENLLGVPTHTLKSFHERKEAREQYANVSSPSRSHGGSAGDGIALADAFAIDEDQNLHSGSSHHKLCNAAVDKGGKELHEGQEMEPAPLTPDKCDIVDKDSMGVKNLSAESKAAADIVDSVPLVASQPAIVAEDIGKRLPESENAGVLEVRELLGGKNRISECRLDVTESSKVVNSWGKFEDGGGLSQFLLAKPLKGNNVLSGGLDVLVDAAQVASGSSFAAQDERPGADDQAESCDGAQRGLSSPKRKGYAVKGEQGFRERQVVRRPRSVLKRDCGPEGVESKSGGRAQTSVPVSPAAYCKGSQKPCSSKSKQGGNKNVVLDSQDAKTSGVLAGLKALAASENMKKIGGPKVDRDGVPSSPSVSDTCSGQRDSNATSNVQKETGALVRSKRGRTQALPSRFRDSVVEPLRKKSGKEFKQSPNGLKPITMLTNHKKRLKRPSQESANTMADSEQLGKELTRVQEERILPESMNRHTKREDRDSKGCYLRESQGEMDMDDISDTEAKGSTAGFAAELQDFSMGAIVWAKSGKRNDPMWPAKVIDPIKDAPELVRKLSMPNHLCVMFYGPSFSKDKERDYALVKKGMLFPFDDGLERFQQQSHVTRPKDFRQAINEAKLADCGFEEGQGSLRAKINPSAKLTMSVDGRDEADDVCLTNTDKNVPNTSEKAAFTGGKVKQTCPGCGVQAPFETSSEEKPLCKNCVKLYKNKQYCGACKKVWLPREKSSFAQCDKCKLWVHAACDKLTSKKLKELADGASYNCPECRKLQGLGTSRKRKIADRMGERLSSHVAPDRLAVACCGMQGEYLPKFHEILCKCEACGEEGKSMKPSEWERHTGCRKRKWKESIRVKKTDQALAVWIQHMLDSGAVGLAYEGPDVSIPAKLRERALTFSLQVPYKPVVMTWTLEKCAVCGQGKDDDCNKMIMCNRCQVAVHEECYGVKASENSGSWVCRACETLDIESECCLCPIKGGALKPTTIKGLWVHITCAWCVPEVTFKNPLKLEPADGLLNIGSSRFRQACTICRQIHGACIRCANKNCRTSFHAMCAFKASYHMEVQSVNNILGVPMRKMITYCHNHRTPNPDTFLVLKPSQGKAPTQITQLQLEKTEGLVSLSTKHCRNNKFAAARCRSYNRANHKRMTVMEACHHVTGYSWDSFKNIKCLRKMEQTSICFGKSANHGWGLFAHRDIQEGEMVLEYRGERVRRSVANLREQCYKRQGRDCYLFQINNDMVIDATEKGNIGRHIKHSSEPNCFVQILNFKKEGQNGEEDSHIVFIALKNVTVGEELTFDEEDSQKRKWLFRASR